MSVLSYDQKRLICEKAREYVRRLVVELIKDEQPDYTRVNPEQLEKDLLESALKDIRNNI